MTIPIQMNTKESSTNMGPGNNLVNGKSGLACNGFSGNLNSFIYGLNNDYRQKLTREFNHVGQLAQFETVNSPYYTQVKVDPEYIKFLQDVSNCTKQ